LKSWLAGLTELSKHGYVSPYSIAQTYARLGEKDKALTWLEMAYEQHDSKLPPIAVEPMFEGMRSDPRFRSLVSRLKLRN
jgi:hypothetical protein